VVKEDKKLRKVLDWFLMEKIFTQRSFNRSKMNSLARRNLCPTRLNLTRSSQETKTIRILRNHTEEVRHLKI